MLDTLEWNRLPSKQLAHSDRTRWPQSHFVRSSFMIEWATCESEFRPDGSERDIYIRNTGVADWNARLGVIRAVNHRFSVGGSETRLPESITDEFFDRADKNARLLVIDAGGVQVDCHFFEPHTIELSIDPARICDQRSLNAVIDVMRLIGDAVGRETLLCFVDGWRRPIIRYLPSTKAVEYRPA